MLRPPSEDALRLGHRCHDAGRIPAPPFSYGDLDAPSGYPLRRIHELQDRCTDPRSYVHGSERRASRRLFDREDERPRDIAHMHIVAYAGSVAGRPIRSVHHERPSVADGIGQSREHMAVLRTVICSIPGSGDIEQPEHACAHARLLRGLNYMALRHRLAVAVRGDGIHGSPLGDGRHAASSVYGGRRGEHERTEAGPDRRIQHGQGPSHIDRGIVERLVERGGRRDQCGAVDHGLYPELPHRAMHGGAVAHVGSDLSRRRDIQHHRLVAPVLQSRAYGRPDVTGPACDQHPQANTLAA